MPDRSHDADVGDPQIVDRLVEFGTALREAGLPIGTDDVLTFCAAVAELTPSDLEDVYWSGRSTLVHRRDHIPVYDELFRRYFLHVPAGAERKHTKDRHTPQGSTGTINVPDAEPGDRESEEPPLVLDAAFSYSSHGKIRIFHQKGCCGRKYFYMFCAVAAILLTQGSAYAVIDIAQCPIRVPEPSTLALMGAAIGGISIYGVIRRRNRNKKK